MWSGSRSPRSRALIAVGMSVALALQATAGTAASTSSPPLRDYSLVFGEMAQLWSSGAGTGLPDDWFDVAAPTTSMWVVSEPLLVEGRYLDLHVTVTPPDPTLLPPASAGPAVLFTSLGLLGGFGGDVGFERLVSVQHTDLPTCGEPCQYETDVRVDLRRLPHVARSVPRLHASTAAIGLSLVRSFGGGTWFQEVPAGDLAEHEGWSGTLGSPEPWTGPALPQGLFPRSALSRRLVGDEGPRTLGILDAARATFGDDSQPVTTVSIRVIAMFDGCDEPVTTDLRSPAGDAIGLARERRRDVLDAQADVPPGSTWRLDWNQSLDPLHDFTVGTGPLLVVATLRCDPELGRVVRDMMTADVR